MERKGKPTGWRRRCMILLIAGLTVAVGVVTVLRVFAQPQALFEDSTVDLSNIQRSERIPMAGPAGGDLTEGEPAEETKELPSLPNIVNIMLMGIDAYEDGTTTSGTQPHADVCMVLAVNFNEDRIDLVSLPRDLFTVTPGYYGYYKLNCVFNVGGGMEDPDSGFEQVCRTAEQWMGGVSIPYYYGVDFQAVMDLVDAVGGIDFEVDTSFHTLSGMYYTPGMQHLDGDGVMGYLRVRTEADGLDSSRTQRQRKMLLALFQKLKAEGTFSDLLSAGKGVYTNANLAQTTALLNYAVGIGSGNIAARSMDAPISTNYLWAFGFVDQQRRIDIIRDIYGFEALPVGLCTTEYESWVHDVGFSVLKTLHRGEEVLKSYEEQRGAGGNSGQDTAQYTACVAAYTALQDTYNEADTEMLTAAGKLKISPEEVDGVRAKYADLLNRLTKEAQTAITELAHSFNCIASLSWYVDWETWPWDKDINQVTVDFN